MRQAAYQFARHQIHPLIFIASHVQPPPREDDPNHVVVEKHPEDSALEHANNHHTNEADKKNLEWDARVHHHPTNARRHYFHDSWLGLVENALRLADLCPPELPLRRRRRRQDSDSIWHNQNSPPRQPQPQKRRVQQPTILDDDQDKDNDKDTAFFSFEEEETEEEDPPRSSPPSTTTSCSCPTLHQPHPTRTTTARPSSYSIHVQATYSSHQSRHGSRVPQQHPQNDQNENDEKAAAPNGSRHRPWPGLQQALDHVARLRRHSHNELARQPQPLQEPRTAHSTANGTSANTTICAPFESCIHVWLHEGIYELTRPLVLHGPWHSHVTIQAMPGHTVWIVGSRRVMTTTKPTTRRRRRRRTTQSSQQTSGRGHTNSRRNSSSSTGKLPQKQQQPQRPTTRNKKRESNTIYALDLRDWWLEWNRKTRSQSASSASETRMGGGDNDLQQQSRDDDPNDTNKKNDDHSSVHDVDVPKLVSLFAGHHDNDESIRYVRARWPNANPELDQWGYASPHKLQYSIDSAAVVEWHRPPPGRPPQFTWINFDTPSNNSSSVPRKNNSAMSGYNGYASGVGGVCADLWGPLPSYWCSNHSQGGWTEVDQECAQTGHLQLPLSMTYNLTALQERPDYPHHYPHDDRNHQHGPNWTGGIVHAWHSQTWSMHMFEITHQHHGPDPAPNGPTTGRLQFAPGGGRQGGRNWCRCDQCTYAASWCGQHDATQPWKDTRLISGTWMVENVLDELDQPGEYFLDRQDLILYVIPNKTSITDSHDDENNDTTNKNDRTSDYSSQDTDLRDTHKVDKDTWVQDFRLGWLERLLDLRDGVEDVTIQNLGFRETAGTYLAPDWSAPSGGDWSLHRNGAIFLQNVSNITIRHCRFEKLDGTAIFLSQKTRHVTIEHSSFAWLGENAIATWGETKDYDGTEENFPMYTVIQHNLMRELGIYQKQSSAVGQCKAAMTTIRNNIMFNMPRAAINFNDMLGGGDIVEGNLIFNTCRESGDHGPINTWDRQPFLTTLRYGTDTPSFDPIPRIIRHNLIFANYGASQGVDNDDGSSWYHIYRNVFYDAKGFKMDYGGHDSVFEDNLVLSYGLNQSDCFEVGNFLPGHGHVMRQNKCLVGLQGDSHPYHHWCGDPMCSEHSSMYRPPPQSPQRHMKQQNNDSPKSRSRSHKIPHHSSWRNASSAPVIVGTMYSACENSSFGLSSNQYFTPTGSAAIQCNGQLFDLETVQRHFHLEQGSTVQALPSNVSTIVEWVWETLIDDKSRRN